MKVLRIRSSYVFLIFIVIIFLGILLFKKDLLLTSDEMKHLKSIESSLNLPTPDRRSEDDRGCNTDYKGAFHYNRTIHINYKNIESAFTAKKRLEENGWIASSENVDNEGEMYWYHNDKNS